MALAEILWPEEDENKVRNWEESLVRVGFVSLGKLECVRRLKERIRGRERTMGRDAGGRGLVELGAQGDKRGPKSL